MSATFGLKPYNANASDRDRQADRRRAVPARPDRDVGRPASSRAGCARAAMSTTGFALEDFDLALGATRDRQGAARPPAAGCSRTTTSTRSRSRRSASRPASSHAMFDGKVDIDDERRSTIAIDGDFPDLDVWLKRFELPPLFARARGGGGDRASPATASPVADRSAADGHRRSPACRASTSSQLDARVSRRHRRRSARSARPGLGGKLDRQRADPASAATSPVDRAAASDGQPARRVAKLCGLAGIVEGHASTTVEVDLRGTRRQEPRGARLAAISRSLRARRPRSTIYDDELRGHVGVHQPPRRRALPAPGGRATSTPTISQQCDDAKKRGGGSAWSRRRRATPAARSTRRSRSCRRATASARRPRASAARSRSADLPLAVIDQFAASDVRRRPVRDDARTCRGTPNAPQATGAIQILRSWVAERVPRRRAARRRAGTVRGSPRPRAQAARRSPAGSRSPARSAPRAPYPVELSLTGRRIEIDPFVDLAAMLRQPGSGAGLGVGHGHAADRAAARSMASRSSPEAWIELSELQGDGHASQRATVIRRRCGCR